MPTIDRVIPSFDLGLDVIVVGAGACGLSAGLAAADQGVDVLVLERDTTALGSTAMSTGLIPAAGTPEQAALGILDTPNMLFEDIMSKSKRRADPAVARRLAEESAETVAWLRDAHGVPLSLVTGFLYPGHTALRMYGTPNRSGGELQAALEAGLKATSATLMTNAAVDVLYVEDDQIRGVGVLRQDGTRERIGCAALVLACCGFGGTPDLVARWIPEMRDATFHGHPGNRGDATIWGESLGAHLADMSGYQGHGGLAAGHGVPILWPLIVEGGVQVNAHGARFSDESLGYSEQAAKVNAQPGAVAWSLFDERLHALMMQFDDYRDALRAGAVLEAETIEDLAARSGIPFRALRDTVMEVEARVRDRAPDRFGRVFLDRPPLTPPYRAVKVTGALFHTQGGLAVTPDAKVLKTGGGIFPNLYAGGGAARGVSGPNADGYIAGNGLLTATGLGKIAGRTAAMGMKAPAG